MNSQCFQRLAKSIPYAFTGMSIASVPMAWEDQTLRTLLGMGKDAMGKKDPVVLLVVEDDREMRSLLCDELWDLGCRILEAGDGDEAVQRIVDSPPDLILTDLRMPAGGLDYVARLRTSAPHCPIIVMTAFGDAKTKAEALQFGVAAYFDKPVRMADLKSAVKKLVWDHDPSEPEENNQR